MRSGLRNRSNSSPCLIGSSSVIPNAQATMEPAADPRPGPTRIPFVFGVLHQVGNDQEVARKSHVGMTPVSYSACARCSSGTLPWKRRGQTTFNVFDEEGVFALPFGHSELRHEVGVLVELHFAAFGNEQRVIARLWQFGPQPRASRLRS